MFHIYLRAICKRKKRKINFSTSAALYLIIIREIHFLEHWKLNKMAAKAMD